VIEFGVNDRDGDGILQCTIAISVIHSKLDGLLRYRGTDYDVTDA